jgi:hypothetical protein
MVLLLSALLSRGASGADYGTAAEAQGMLKKAVAELKKDDGRSSHFGTRCDTRIMLRATA